MPACANSSVEIRLVLQLLGNIGQDTWQWRLLMAKILIIDDDVELSGLVEFGLTNEKHEVKKVHLGFEGWKEIQTGQYELVVLDWDLPDFNGIDLLKKYRDEGGQLPVILLTGHTSVDDKERGLDSGANDYLTKPFHLKELTARIRNLLRNAAPAAPQLKPLGSGNEEVLKRGDLLGTQLAARYEFLDVLGEGGVAIVFKAMHPQLEKIVAVKMIQATELVDENIARFEREAKTISKLDHPNIIQVYDFGVTEKKHPYMVMEFIEGVGLDIVIRDEDYVRIKRGLDILLPVCDGIAHAHEEGILHRDIKPSNVMLKQVGNRPVVPKILDFGLAKLTQVDPQKAVQLTQARQIIGSPPYMSPEQVRGKPLDHRSDIYSFGCVIFEVLSGYPPHVGDSATEVMFKHLEEPPLTFEETRPELTFPDEIKQLIARALQVDPESRYQSMRELQNDLQAVSRLVAAE